MAPETQKIEVKHASLSEIFQPCLFADQPKPLMLSTNPELLTLEARLRTITTLEIYWGILRPTNKTGEKNVFDLNPHILHQAGEDGKETALTAAFLAACSSKGSTPATEKTVPSTVNLLSEQEVSKTPSKASMALTVPPTIDNDDPSVFSAPSSQVTSIVTATPTASGIPLASLTTTEQVRKFLTKNPIAKAVFNAKLERAVSKIEGILRAPMGQPNIGLSSSIYPVLGKEGVEQYVQFSLRLNVMFQFELTRILMSPRFLNANPFAKQLFEERVKLGVSRAESPKAGQIFGLSQVAKNNNQGATQPYTMFGTEALSQLLNTNSFAKAAFEERVKMKVEQDKVLIHDEMETKRLQMEEQLQNKYNKTVAKMKTDFERKKEVLELERYDWMSPEEAEMARIRIRKRGICINDSDALKLISHTPQVANTYRDLCVEALRVYKEDLKTQYQQKLNEIEAEYREQGRALHDPHVFDIALPEVDRDAVRMLENRLRNESNKQSPWAKKIQELLKDEEHGQAQGGVRKRGPKVWKNSF